MAYPRFDNFNSRFFEPILILSLQDLGSIARELALLSYCPAICELLLGSKRGRKMGKNALKYGAVAGVGALAWKAYQNYQTIKLTHSKQLRRLPRSSSKASSLINLLGCRKSSGACKFFRR